MVAKLLEHFYYGNHFVLGVASKFFKKKGQLAWVGDYADESDFNWNEEMNGSHSDDVYTKLKYNGFRLEDKVLINHTKKEIVDLDTYKEKK